MEKFKLNFEDLEVESFETTTESEGKEGTVYGFGETDTCGATCPDTCPPRSCLGTSGGFPCA